jgi:hypothetical protein
MRQRREDMGFLNNLFGKKNPKTGNKPFNIDDLLNSKDVNNSIIEIDNLLGQLCLYGDEMGKLNDCQKIFYLNQCLEREINNGGFNQFYFNSSGNFAEETVVSLNAVGALKTAAILFHANSFFPEGKVPKDQEQRQELLEEIEKDGNSKWQQLEDKFMVYEEDLNSLNMNYIKANKDKFGLIT